MVFWKFKLNSDPEKVVTLCDENELLQSIYMPGSKRGISDTHLKRIKSLSECAKVNVWVSLDTWEKKVGKQIGGTMCEHFLIPYGLIERDKKIYGQHRYRLTSLGQLLIEKYYE